MDFELFKTCLIFLELSFEVEDIFNYGGTLLFRVLSKINHLGMTKEKARKWLRDLNRKKLWHSHSCCERVNVEESELLKQGIRIGLVFLLLVFQLHLNFSNLWNFTDVV